MPIFNEDIIFDSSHTISKYLIVCDILYHYSLTVHFSPTSLTD
jgi:hypothetical protein